MSTSRQILAASAAIFLMAASSEAAIVTVSFDSGDFTVFSDLGGTVALSGGSPTIDGDGFVLQLGYFSGATTGNNFSGTFIPLTGAGSANTGSIAGTTINFNQTTIGDLKDAGAGDGTFAFPSITFDTTDATRNQNLPSSTAIPLAIRFYNGSSLGSATLFNTVSNDAWVWKTPADAPNNPNITMSLNDANLEWQSIAQGGAANTAFKTTIAVPEPTSAALAGVALLGLATSRRRRTR